MAVIKRTSHLVFVCTISILGSVLGFSQSFAENTPRPELEQVLVTASKSGEVDLQSIPIAITSVSADELDLSNISNIKDLSLLAPGITVSQNTNYGQLYIRGIGSNYIFVGGDPSSTIHVDGVYLARPASVFSELLELERVEVLRGPQGTLYGRNSTGGTINLITAKPTEQFLGKASLELGNYSKYRVNGFVNGALALGNASQKVMANAAFSVAQRDGYVKNNNPSGVSELNDEDRQNLRTALRYVPTDSLTIDLALDYFERDETPPAYKPQLLMPTGTVPAGRYTQQAIDDFWRVKLSTDPSLEEQSSGVNVTVTWQVNEYSRFTSISSHREFDIDLLLDSDFSEVAALITGIEENQEQDSQEFRFNFDWQSLSISTGVFYFQEEIDFDSSVQALVFPPPDFLAVVARPARTRHVESDASALYVDVGWEFHPQWKLLAGGRYSDEEKDWSGDTIDPVNDSWTDFSPRLGIQYQPNQSTMLYAIVSEGFKTGGYNFSDSSDIEAFDPEEIVSYEVGIKTEFADYRTRLNAAAFIYDYTDLQVLSFVGDATVRLTNASDADVRGLEIELLTYLSDQWRISAAGTYLNAEYDDYQARRSLITCAECSDVDIDVSGNKLNNAPRSSFSLVTDYNQAFAGGSLLYRLEHFWQEKIYFTAFNDNVSSQESYRVINASITYAASGDQWQLQLYGKNLDDEEYSTASQDFSRTGVNNLINPPRTYGLKGTYRFN